MSETAQIILAISIGVVFLVAAFSLAVFAIDTIKAWKNDQNG